MPIYEYKCEHCDETFEVLQKFSDDPLTECILCHAGPVKKLISVSSFVLKGAGFYVNDYAKKSDGKETDSSSPPNNKSSESSKSSEGSKSSESSKSSEGSKSKDSSSSSTKKDTSKTT